MAGSTKTQSISALNAPLPILGGRERTGEFPSTSAVQCGDYSSKTAPPSRRAARAGPSGAEPRAAGFQRTQEPAGIQRTFRISRSPCASAQDFSPSLHLSRRLAVGGDDSHTSGTADRSSRWRNDPRARAQRARCKPDLVKKNPIRPINRIFIWNMLAKAVLSAGGLSGGVRVPAEIQSPV